MVSFTQIKAEFQLKNMDSLMNKIPEAFPLFYSFNYEVYDYFVSILTLSIIANKVKSNKRTDSKKD
jgi:hypothetical protein